MFTSTSHTDIHPRYTCGSPALVPNDQGVKIAKQESEAYFAAVRGEMGEDEQRKAIREGRAGIAIERWQRAGHDYKRDLIIDEKTRTPFAGRPVRLDAEEAHAISHALQTIAEHWTTLAGQLRSTMRSRDAQEEQLARQLERQAVRARHFGTLFQDYPDVTMVANES